MTAANIDAEPAKLVALDSDGLRNDVVMTGTATTLDGTADAGQLNVASLPTVGASYATLAVAGGLTLTGITNAMVAAGARFFAAAQQGEGPGSARCHAITHVRGPTGVHRGRVPVGGRCSQRGAAGVSQP